MSQRTTILIVSIVAVIAAALWVASRVLLESAVEPAPVERSTPPVGDDGRAAESAPVEHVAAPERPDYSAPPASTDPATSVAPTADGLYQDLKSAADSIGEARDQVRLPAGTLTLESPKRAVDDSEEEGKTEPEPDP